MSQASEDRAERFAEMYNASYASIYAYASRRLGAAAADEIAAETFLVAWRKFDRLPSEPLPWLFGVARNVVMRDRTDSARRRGARDALIHEHAWQQPEGAEIAEAGLRDAWEQLRPADREVLALVACEDLSVADAARVLGCSAPVLSVGLHRARGRLERLMSPPAAIPATELSEV